MLKQLKKFLPPTRRFVESRLDKLDFGLDKALDTGSQIAAVQKKIQAQAEDIAQANHKINAAQKELQKQIDHVKKECADLKESLEKSLKETEKIEKQYFYRNEYEARVIESFYAAYEKADFEDRFLKLIQNLDAGEIAKIVCILQRQRLVMAAKGQEADLYLKEEQEAVRAMKCYMKSHIFKVSGRLFCYDHYMLPRNHFEASVFYYKHGIDGLKEKSFERIKGKDIADIGGFYGDSVLILEELQPRSIYTFESIQENYDVLKETLRINHIHNCTAEKLALGAEEGEAVFDVKGSQSNMQTIDYLMNIDGREKVQVTTFDKYAAEHKLEVGLIKVDIEGAEQQFLHGAKKTIASQKPVLLISIYHNADDFFDIKPLIESWNLGYKFSIHKPCDYTISREVLLVCEI